MGLFSWASKWQSYKFSSVLLSIYFFLLKLQTIILYLVFITKLICIPTVYERFSDFTFFILVEFYISENLNMKKQIFFTEVTSNSRPKSR